MKELSTRILVSSVIYEKTLPTIECLIPVPNVRHDGPSHFPSIYNE